MSPGVLAGTLTKEFDPVTGLVTFDDLTLSAPGRYSLKVQAVSTPSGYDVWGRSTVVEVNNSK